MSLLWREQLSVSNDVIDNDHKHLIDIINLVEVSLGKKDKAELTRALYDLSQYSMTHFEREEKIAAAVGYTDTPKLHKSHELLVVGLEKLKVQIGSDWTDDAAARFCSFLRDWLINHVIKEDLLMKPFLEKRSPKFDGTAQSAA